MKEPQRNVAKVNKNDSSMKKRRNLFHSSFHQIERDDEEIQFKCIRSLTELFDGNFYRKLKS